MKALSIILFLCVGCAHQVSVPAPQPKGLFDMHPCGHSMQIHADYALVELPDLGKAEIKGATFQMKNDNWCYNQ